MILYLILTAASLETLRQHYTPKQGGCKGEIRRGFPRAHIRLHFILGRDIMPHIAAKSVLAANNNPLPDFWEFFCVLKIGRIDGVGLPYRQSLLNINPVE